VVAEHAAAALALRADPANEIDGTAVLQEHIYLGSIVRPGHVPDHGERARLGGTLPLDGRDSDLLLQTLAAPSTGAALGLERALDRGKILRDVGHGTDGVGLERVVERQR
jgi:hypothetical protein